MIEDLLLYAFAIAAVVGGVAMIVVRQPMRVAMALVAGCDVWLNLPRPPMEASGTSGMKAAINGGLNVSVMDGWWAEAYDGTNGWGFNGHADPDEAAQDARALERALLALSDEHRLLVVLREVEQLSYEEIVEITGLPEGTIKSRLHRARAALLAALPELREGLHDAG